MKNFALIAKIVTAIAAVVGFAYIIATYGEQIIEWAKKLLNSCPCKCTCDDCADCECELDCPADDETEVEVFVAEDEEEEVEAEDEPAEEGPVEETAPVAEEADFE
ncbi:MAG: hypothetical protein IKY17_06915 [Oscillospiraceae bacterium]|nr:hypothetical protein [Oscillospiraceae bacterium]